MKLRYLFYLLLFSLSHSLSAQNVVVSLDFHKVLYVGLDNPISVAVEGVKSKDIIVNITGYGNHIQKVVDGKYIAKVVQQKDSNFCLINIYTQSKGKVKLLSSKSYRIKFVHKGEVKFGSLSNNGFYTKEEILNQKELVYQNDASIQDILNYKIVQYQFLHIPKRGFFEQVTCNGSQINETVRNMIKHSMVGDLIVIDRIKISNGHSTSELKPITFNVAQINKGLFKIEGLVFKNDQIFPFLYPESANQEDSFPNEASRHGIWKTEEFSYHLNIFFLKQKDSFHYGKLLYTEIYSDSQLEYRIDFLPNKIFQFTSYYKNGKAFQTGEIDFKKSAETFNYEKYYPSSVNPNKDSDFAEYRINIEGNYYPKGQWKIFNQNGQLIQSFNYLLIYDSLRYKQYLFKTDQSFSTQEPEQFYLIVLDGTAVSYNKEGKVEKRIVFRNGFPVKR
jgi:hypothetical protein